jgi:hypothetical protein
VEVRLLVACAAAIACLLLNACGGGGGTPGSDSTGQSLIWDSGHWDINPWF